MFTQRFPRALSLIPLLVLVLFVTQCQVSDDTAFRSTTISTMESRLVTVFPEQLSITPMSDATQLPVTAESSIGYIVFVSDRDGNEEIYLVNLEESQQYQLTDNATDDFFPQWSPDGQWIMFVSDRDGNYEIYKMRPDGTVQTNLSQNSGFDGQPNWSPDGRFIVFVSDRDGTQEIYIMKADGTSQTRLTKNSARKSKPIWSLDGKQIAFVSDHDSNHEVYVMNADGSQQRHLTNHPAIDGDPAWSPDGQYIVFSSTRDSREDVIFVNSALYMISVDGGEPVALTDSSSSNTSPVWSPDGKYIAFVSDRDSVRGRVPKLYLMDVATREVWRLTDDDMLAYPVPHEFSPTWSPDGQYLAFTLDDGIPQIYIIHIESGELFQLTDSDARNRSPHWWGP